MIFEYHNILKYSSFSKAIMQQHFSLRKKLISSGKDRRYGTSNIFEGHSEKLTSSATTCPTPKAPW